MIRYIIACVLIAAVVAFVIYKASNWIKPIKKYVYDKEEESLNKFDKKLNGEKK